jgi:zinc protease
VKTFVLPSAGSPFVAFRLMFETGARDDPTGKEGLAALTGGLLVEGGAGSLSFAGILEALYPMAAGLSVQVDREVTVVHGTVHRDHLDRYYEILRDVVLRPRFDAADLERLRSDQSNAITAGLRATDDEGLGKEALNAMIHRGGAYGRPVEGTVRGIASITRQDVLQFHATRLTSDVLTIGLAGNVPDGFAERVAGDLSKLRPGGPTRAALAEARHPVGLEALVVTKPCRAWAISLGMPIDVTRSDEDFFALYLAASYLGEHRTFNGVLMNSLRADRGLNYGDYAYAENFVQDGMTTFALPNVPRRQQTFSIWIRPVAEQHAHFALRLAFRELARVVKEGLTPEAFADTREFLLAYSPLWVQTPSRRLGYALDGAFYGRKSLVEDLQDVLPRLTAAQVNDAIARHLRADAAYLAVVADPGEAATFVEGLATNRPSPIVYDTETKPEVLKEDREIASYPLPVARARIRTVAAEALFETAALPGD